MASNWIKVFIELLNYRESLEKEAKIFYHHIVYNNNDNNNNK